jgi:2-polyprenyl-3-methyl-5-hydroxy-6-metoxy-1,4-benzoquinol methylase
MKNNNNKNIHDKFLNLIIKLSKNFKNNNDIKILDWGCGKGELINYLKNKNFNS